MTGRPAWAAIAAVRLDERIQHLVDCGAIYWQQITPEDLNPD